MFKEILQLAKAVLTLANDVQQSRVEVKEIRQELRDLTIIVHALSQEIILTKEQAAQRHEALLLEIENRLLRFEKALPAPEDETAKKGGVK